MNRPSVAGFEPPGDTLSPFTTGTPSTGRQYTLLKKGCFPMKVISLGVLGVVAVTTAGLA
jgi:hypothetical protein